MSVDPSVVGRSYPAGRPYEVSREKIREFAVAAGDDNPAFRDVGAARALGHPDLVAPPTFPIVVVFGLLEQVMADPELGLTLRHVVHADQKFSYTRPVHAGDRLTATLTIDAVRQAAGADLIKTRTELTTPEGEPVCTALAGIAHRGEAS